MIKWQKELNSEQLAAVTFNEGSLLILAGAGSGKTRVLTYRVAWLMEEKRIPAEKILLLTFTNKAAGEMKERVKQLVGQEIGFAGTFHSFCAAILRRWGPVIGLDRNFVIYDETDRLQAVKMAMKELNIKGEAIKAGSVVATISRAKNEMLSQADYFNLARGERQKLIANIWQVYERNLKKFVALDFDDLLLLGVKLLQTEEGESIARRFEQILIDEYQDTNKAQYTLTKLLVRGRDNLTVVGDFAQSIYSWRGADFRNLNYLTGDFPKITQARLTINYRSCQNILDAAYGVITQNTSHPVLALEAVNERGEKITLFEARDEKEEARFVLDRLAGELNNYAVLYRTNAQSRVLEEALIRRGIPYVLVGGTRFYERREIKDLVAFLRVLANPEDEVAWERIDKVGKRRRAAFEEWRRQARGRTTEELLAGVLKSTNYLSLYDEKNENDLMRLENIKELASVAREFADLTAFLENVTLVQDEARVAAGRKQGVTLTTIHAAKGLEFETVFLVGLEEGLFPHSRSLLDRDNLEEERRLMYVAVTRAKKKLYLTHAERRLYFGQRSSATPSRFLSEIPTYLVDWGQSPNVRLGTVPIRGQSPNGPQTVDKRVIEELVRDDFEEIDSW